MHQIYHYLFYPIVGLKYNEPEKTTGSSGVTPIAVQKYESMLG